MYPDKITDSFQRIFHVAPALVICAPGRINLIGEHTDYNNGFVLPAAIDKAIWLAVSPRSDDRIELFADDINDACSADLQHLVRSDKGWPNYLLGTFDELRKAGHTIHGANVVLGGNIPAGAGLSSSAAMASGLLFALNELYDLGLSGAGLAQLAQRSENNFVGMNCGIMDMYASLMGQKGHALLLDCRDLTTRYISVDLPDYTFILCNSGVKHALVDSEYNTRRRECEAGVQHFQSIYPDIHSLRDVTEEMLLAEKKNLPDLIFRRCQFIITEKTRVLRAAEALEQGELTAFGALLYATHDGLQHQFEISCPEIDFLVDETRDLPYVLGARMMGGGFGGCTLNLVHNDFVQTFEAHMQAAYQQHWQHELPCYEVTITDGVRIVPAGDFNTAPHRRFNPLTGEWVLVSPHRAQRPWQGQVEKTPTNLLPAFDPGCYLCPGNMRANGEQNPDYSDVFVFTNDFAALLPDVPTVHFQEGDLFRAESERGICRVVCFSPRHDLTIPTMEPAAVRRVVDTWCTEYAELSRLPYVRHIQIFENKGAIMGCSNPHSHGQIWAQETVPGEVVRKQANQARYFQQHQRTLLSDYLARELDKQERVVFENQHFVCVVPFWAVWPFETMLLPKRAMATITAMTDAERDFFAAAYQQLTICYDRLFETSFPYSAGIHQAPVDGVAHPEWHWHTVFYPPLLRSATVKKFMVGYEMLASPQRDITAEKAAAVLKEFTT